MSAWNKLLRKIEQSPDRDFWSLELSGNILELSVPPPRESKVDEYRRSVIKIGKIIQQIRNEQKAGLPKPTVQLFPNLMDIRLIAVLRPAENGRHTEDSFTNQKFDISFDEFIKNNTEESSIFADTLNPDNEILQHLNINRSSEQYKACVISSLVNNPFIWVRTGYILENILTYFNKKEITDKPEIFENLNIPLKKIITKRLTDNRVPQAIVLLNKETLAI